MIHSYRIESDELRLRPLEERDIESLREWRNNAEFTQYLTKLPTITLEMQRNWFRRYLADETEITLAIEYIGEGNTDLIGSVAFSDIQNGRAECGKFMIGNTAYKGRGFGSKSLALCLKMAFQQMGLEVCEAHAHPLNAASFVAFINEGFQIKGSRPFAGGGFEYAMELSKARYSSLNGR